MPKKHNRPRSKNTRAKRKQRKARANLQAILAERHNLHDVPSLCDQPQGTGWHAPKYAKFVALRIALSLAVAFALGYFFLPLPR